MHATKNTYLSFSQTGASFRGDAVCIQKLTGAQLTSVHHNNFALNFTNINKSWQMFIWLQIKFTSFNYSLQNVGIWTFPTVLWKKMTKLLSMNRLSRLMKGCQEYTKYIIRCALCWPIDPKASHLEVAINLLWQHLALTYTNCWIARSHTWA